MVPANEIPAESRLEVGETGVAGYDTASLEQLAAAYRAELEGFQAEYRRLKGARASVRSTQGVEAGVREFERVQGTASRLRDVTTEVASREARIQEIEQELARRGWAATGFALHLQRLTGVAIPI